LRIFLMRLGWVGEDDVICEPVPGVTSRLKCRGQVTAKTRTVTYEVVIKERGYGPDAYAIVDALMYADGKPVVDIGDMSIRFTGLTRQRLEQTWTRLAGRQGCGGQGLPPLAIDGRPFGAESQQPTSPEGASVNSPGREPWAPGHAATVTRQHILAYAIGSPVEAFGPRYAEFETRFLARLPGPPFLFVDRITHADAEPFVMKAGGTVTGEYDVPPDAWYFAEYRAPLMPFCVLLEAALQVCGWTSAYIGSALTSPTPLHYRNLGGKARQLRDVTPATGTLTTTVKVTRVAASGGMIIQDFDIRTSDATGPVYEGSTTFGFFSPEALAQQVGIRDGSPRVVSGTPFIYPPDPPFPGEMLRMMDEAVMGAGVIEGRKRVRPEEWFFKAHFYQDPVWPGSLGLEALIQLLQVVAVQTFGPCRRFTVNHVPHQWTYRGQVLPTNSDVGVHGIVTGIDQATRTVTGDGWLSVDGRAIYRMAGFTVRAVP
jgi:3-hydroxymyristoyl/3-hydroxydecanoyl-(acyl carrier protein) dehydratase